jgi:hypothetical protein
MKTLYCHIRTQIAKISENLEKDLEICPASDHWMGLKLPQVPLSTIMTIWCQTVIQLSKKLYPNSPKNRIQEIAKTLKKDISEIHQDCYEAWRLRQIERKKKRNQIC